MVTFQLGERVTIGPGRTGVVVGFGWQQETENRVTLRRGDCRPNVLVRLDAGAYLHPDDDTAGIARVYVSVLVVSPDNLERIPDPDSEECPQCHGAGISDPSVNVGPPCETCKGKGTV